MPPILKQPFDPTFDFSRGVPATEILTIHRVLTFDGPHAKAVETALINSLHIEKASLVPRRADGDVLMRTRPHNVESCFSGDGYRLSFDGGSSSQTMNPWSGHRRLNPDVTEQVEAAKAELVAAGQDAHRLRANKDGFDQQLTEIANASKAALQREATLKKAIQNLTAEKTRLTERLREDEPADIASLEDARNEAQTEHDSTVAQFASLNEQKEQTNREAQPLIDKKSKMAKDLEEKREVQSKIAERMNSAVRKQQDEQQALASWQAKLAAQAAQILEFEQSLARLHDSRAERVDQASHLCQERPVVEKKRSVDRIDKDIKVIERSLLDRERRTGASVEQIMQQLGVRRKTLDDANQSLAELEQLCLALSRSYDIRIATWNQFREQISIRARDQFLFHLSKRGFSGKINFHHQKTRLDMRVQTEDVASTKSKTKDTKSLSGGEKSFSECRDGLPGWFGRLPVADTDRGFRLSPFAFVLQVRSASF